VRPNELLDHTRQILQMDVGGMPHATFLKSIELLVTEVPRRTARAGLRRARVCHPCTRSNGRTSMHESRAMRSEARDLPPSEEAIEIGLRRRAVESAKDAEVLLRWLQRPRQSPSGLGLDEMGEEELEGLYAGLLRLARLDEDELARLLSSS
jgi:hypothetical protein